MEGGGKERRSKEKINFEDFWIVLNLEILWFVVVHFFWGDF